MVALACHQTLNLGWRLGLSDEEMRAAVAQCRERAGKLDPAQIVRVLCAYVVCQNTRGAIRDNVQPLTQALRMARAERSADMEIDVSIALQHSTAFLGRLKEAERFCTRVIELCRRDTAHVNFGGTSSCIESLANRGLVRAELGLHRKGAEDVELALRLADEQANDESRRLALRAAVLSAELCGAAQPTLSRARRLAQLALRSGSPLWTLDASLCTGIAYAAGGQFDDAIGPLEHVTLRIDERGFARHHLGRALTALARACLGAGRAEDAAKAAERAVRSCRAAGMRSQECAARIALAKVQLAKEGAAARRKLREGLSRVEALVRETGARAQRPFAREVAAQLATLCGDPNAAERELREAQRLFTSMGAAAHAERVGADLEALRGG
jgi:tetratricopeptide (TPR) repeat protein